MNPTTNIPNPSPAELPNLLRHEIAYVRAYLDGLERRLDAHDSTGQWSPSEAYEWAAEMDIQLRQRLPYAERYATNSTGSAACLDRLTRALVAHVFSLGNTIARLSPVSTALN